MNAASLSSLRDLYPWSGSFFDVGDGVRMHHLDEGSGAPLLVLHGNPNWSFGFRAFVSRFSGAHRVVVPDHVGCGLSDKPAADRYPYTLDRRVDDVEALVRHLDLRDVTLVAHDWGGMIGLAWAMRNWERVRRIVLLNTAGFGLPEAKRLPWQIAIVRQLRGSAFLSQGLNAFLRGALLTCTTTPLPRRVRQGYLAPYRSYADRLAIHRFVKDIPLGPEDPSWATVDEVSRNLGRLEALPVMIGWGRKDFVFDDAFLAEWKRRLPGARYVEFSEAGHWVHEDAGDALLDAIDAFLRE